MNIFQSIGHRQLDFIFFENILVIDHAYNVPLACCSVI